MKNIKGLLILILVLKISACKQENEQSSLTLLSDQIPTDIPFIFAPGIISTDNHAEGNIIFSPDMSEIYFNRRKPEESHNIYTLKLIDGQWSKPVLAPFSSHIEYLDLQPRISPQGDKLYFGSTRPLNKTSESKKFRPWYVERNKNGWGQPVSMKEPFTDRFIMCMTPSKSGNLYFNSKEKDEKLEDEGIYFAINSGGQYHKVIKMGNEVNAPGKWIAHPYIAPDESFIIYDAERTKEYENGTYT